MLTLQNPSLVFVKKDILGTELSLVLPLALLSPLRKTLLSLLMAVDLMGIVLLQTLASAPLESLALTVA